MKERRTGETSVERRDEREEEKEENRRNEVQTRRRVVIKGDGNKG